MRVLLTRSKLLFLCVLLLPLIACSDGDRDGEALPVVETRVDAAGGVTFVVDGRETLSTAGAAPQVRSFDEEIRFVVGQWELDRSNEVRTELSRVVEIREFADVTEIDFAAADGPARATLSVTHPEPGRTSLLRLEVTAGSPDSVVLPLRCDAESGFQTSLSLIFACRCRGNSPRRWPGEDGHDAVALSLGETWTEPTAQPVNAVSIQSRTA